MHLDLGQVAQDGGQVLQRRPVELDIGAGSEVAVTLVIGAGDMGQLAHLAAVHDAIGHRDPGHIGVQLQIDAVHQPQRLELVLGQRAAAAAVDLIAELRNALADQGGVELVIAIHQAVSFRAKARLWPTLGPSERMPSFSRSRPVGA
ncbi:hypothetical protein D3C81_1753360 [compost metagenome]